MKKLFSLSMMLICFVAISFAAAKSLDGQWTGTLKTDDAQYPLLYHFKVDGDKLTGTVKGPHGYLPLVDGEVHGTEFSFMVNLEKMHLLHTGKFYPDSVSLDIECDDAKAHTVLTRVVDIASR
jgi:hypothetical protein